MSVGYNLTKFEPEYRCLASVFCPQGQDMAFSWYELGIYPSLNDIHNVRRSGIHGRLLGIRNLDERCQ
jgi:hypothetical protein